ncbi:MAG: bifunctional phosphoribosylaminoimidazolecarboxamide formyltransferase/IMP cyclohydrolase [Planctomycetota bacterium]|nr:bifunctional phosphoribosylaminoimidazolecarboxamide formyltransferase/IMP cyclohydrolase [Planctomycetota bacterium]
MESPKIQRALLSVSDKEGLTDFAQGLHDAGVELYSTGGTSRHLQDAGIPVRDVSDYTNFPEMMDGRVKTLHPKIFAGILCRHDRPDDMNALEEHEIATFELVVVNLYPFQQTVAKPDVERGEAVEKIDIGGPSLVRAAAKNHAFTTIATAASQYAEILGQVQGSGSTSFDLRRKLMVEAFTHTALYDQAISNHFAAEDSEETFRQVVNLPLERVSSLRYGENPHQEAALYRFTHHKSRSVIDAEQLNGKELSYNNYLDLDAAWSIAAGLPDAGVSVIKHNNPCGAASAATVKEACVNAMAGDPVSAFGSILGFNAELDAEAAEFLSTPGLFVEAIAAPSFSAEALEILTTRPKWKNNVRLMQVGQVATIESTQAFRQIDGGMLAQTSDSLADDEAEWKVVTDVTPEPALMNELRFGWAICRHVKSNAITISKDRALRGAGAGQMSRVDSVDIAIRKSGEHCRGGVLASDAFFPFPDSIHKAAEAGIAAIIQPGGSKKDPDVIAACNECKLPMVFTGRRHFKH